MDSSVIRSGVTATGTISIGALRIDFAKESLADWRNLIKRIGHPCRWYICGSGKQALETNLSSLSMARLKELIEEAVVDAYTEEEQAVGYSQQVGHGAFNVIGRASAHAGSS